MKVIVLGCGRVGSGLARALALRGEQVAVVDDDATAFDRLGPSFGGDQIVGSALHRDVLTRAGIDRCDALAAVTGSDEVNAAVARLAARRFHVPHVVARLYDPGKASLYRRLGVQTVSQVEWGTERIIEIITASHAGASFSLGGGQVDLVEVTVSPFLTGNAVAELEVPSEIHVVAVTRAGRTFIAGPMVLFEAGDVVHVAVAAGARARLEHLLEP
jgi:trk system potassium uptake protein TrkA